MPVRLAQYSIAHAHASGKIDAMKKNPDVEFCGIFEPDEKLRAEFENEPFYKDVYWFKSKNEMLDDKSIVGIAVEGSVKDNLAFAHEAVGNGKHIWLDKPAGTDINKFYDILLMAKKKNLLVQLGYMFRYNAGFEFLFDMVKNGNLGKIFSVRGRMSTNIPIDRRPSLGEYQGGILFELLCHLIDIVVWLLGRPQKVISFLHNDLGVTPEFSDNTLAVFEYDSAIAVLESSAMEISPFPARRFEVYGDKGSLIIEPLEPPSARLCLNENRDNYVKGWQKVIFDERHRYAGELVALLEDIKGKKKPDRSLYHELIVQETVLRASNSIEGFLVTDVGALID